ncbi:STAS domain-containing protein [Imhoffiella purpurea]|uniref:Anti-sigma factor antagonist n=1 Tax=Imhoffiella purpurea TaxID=1249627 RepID=W9VZ44_9GAMM|nr:STAS domain-containing protein [Imhoffiella purpurea]EXJ15670.1 anti-sigma F factor antagonist [Imhoffiella purpurea]
MNIEITQQADISIVTVTGKLDALTAPEYERRLGRLIEEGAQRIVVDFGPLVYVSSAGLRALLNTTKPLQARGGRIVYANLQEPVREVFEMTALLTLFRVHDSLADALADV